MKKVYEKIIKDKPYWLYDVLLALAVIVTIVLAIYAGIKAILTISEMKDGIYVISCNRLLAFSCLIVTLFCIVCIIKIMKYGKVIRNMRYEFSKRYYCFLHDFRNAYFDLLKEYKCGNYKSISDRVEKLTYDTKILLQTALDCLCGILQNNTGEKVYACIKVIENYSAATDIDKENATVITFCRSRNTDKNRRINDELHTKSIKVKDNTDFYDILDEESDITNSFFYQGNLSRYDKDLRKVGKKYQNSTEDYEKYYKGTIVAPIKVKKSRLYYINGNDGEDIVGFLCVDSPSNNAFRNTEFDKEINTNIVKSFAAEIYVVLNMYHFYLKRINEGL